MFHYLLVVVVTCWSICPAVLGQRLHRRVDPSSLEEGLTFDTNTLPLVDNGGGALQDLNFSPNVVFSPDSRKAFISYPGSNKVLVFASVDSIYSTGPTSSSVSRDAAIDAISTLSAKQVINPAAEISTRNRW